MALAPEKNERIGTVILNHCEESVGGQKEGRKEQTNKRRLLILHTNYIMLRPT